MSNILFTRLRQKQRTISYPASPMPVLPDRFQGRPEIRRETCGEHCVLCVAACPVNAIQRAGASVRLDLGLCIFCGACERACPENNIHFTTDHRLAASRRADLVLDAATTDPAATEKRLVQALEQKMLKIFGRSLRLRQVSAGGCGACEADVNVLGTIAWDLSRFGIGFAASPRHADGILVTGPVTDNMKLALMKTYDAVPTPKLVIAAGACAISGGIYSGTPEQHNGVSDLLPVSLFIPGCPPHPLTILDGLLRMLDRLPKT